MSNPKTRRRTSLASIVLLVAIISVSFWAVLHRQYLVDQLRVWQFSPSSSVISLRSNLDLTNHGTFLFDASQPVLQQADNFNESCQQQKETNNPIIGCYTRDSIYIYDVNRSELNGIEETTAAHELLHAVYQRLPASERKNLDDALTSAYERVKTPELEKRLSYYEKAEPGQEMNELHSILGTENINLGDTLEAHYAKYFMSRKRILLFHQAYSATFDRITDQLTSLEEDINAAVATINGRIDEYNRNVSILSNDSDDFNTKSENAEFSSQAEFADNRQKLVDRKNDLDAEYSDINKSIDAVKSDRRTYNELVDKYNQLSRSINSSLAPTPSL